MNVEIYVFGKEESVKGTHQGVPFAFNSRPQATVCAADRFRTNKKDTLKRVFFIGASDGT